MTTLLNDHLMQITLRDYVCSNCWGHLLAFIADDKQHWIVKCSRCLDDTKGYVTKYYAEHRRSDSITENWETREMLKELNVIEGDQSNKSEDELIEELGF